MLYVYYRTKREEILTARNNFGEVVMWHSNPYKYSTYGQSDSCAF